VFRIRRVHRNVRLHLRVDGNRGVVGLDGVAQEWAGAGNGDERREVEVAQEAAGLQQFNLQACPNRTRRPASSPAPG